MMKETTAFGAAFMGALGVGDYKEINDIENLWEVHTVYEPRISEDERNAYIYDWHRAVQRAKYWVEN